MCVFFRFGERGNQHVRESEADEDGFLPAHRMGRRYPRRKAKEEKIGCRAVSNTPLFPHYFWIVGFHVCKKQINMSANNLSQTSVDFWMPAHIWDESCVGISELNLLRGDVLLLLVSMHNVCSPL